MEHYAEWLRHEALYLIARVEYWLDWFDCALYRVVRDWRW